MSDIAKETKVESPKTRKPGRPPLVRAREPKVKSGIVATPIEEKHVIEFLYDKPMIFKRTLAFFKLMAVAKVHIVFTKTHIIMYTVDHHKKNHIRVKIRCDNVDHYYCKKELDIGLLSKNLELIMNTIDKNSNGICFLSTVDNSQKNIQIILKNEFEIEESHKIDLLGEYEKNENDDKFLDDEYMLKFTLKCKYFKKMISDILSFSEQVTIRKDSPEDNLVFEYTKSDKKIKSLNIVKNEKAISLQCNLKKDETFRTSFKIDYVKNISGALLSENIEIYADENKPLKFDIQMDESVDITILTDIIDHRKTL